MAEHREFKIFSEKTLIPVSLIGVIIGAAMWATELWKQGEVNAAQLTEFKQQTAVKDEHIYEELVRINEKLDRVVEKLVK